MLPASFTYFDTALFKTTIVNLVYTILYCTGSGLVSVLEALSLSTSLFTHSIILYSKPSKSSATSITSVLTCTMYNTYNYICTCMSVYDCLKNERFNLFDES